MGPRVFHFKFHTGTEFSCAASGDKTTREGHGTITMRAGATARCETRHIRWEGEKGVLFACVTTPTSLSLVGWAEAVVIFGCMKTNSRGKNRRDGGQMFLFPFRDFGFGMIVPNPPSLIVSPWISRPSLPTPHTPAVSFSRTKNYFFSSPFVFS